MNSRNKGKRGEREFRDLLREHGYLNARRGQQFSGGSDSPDVVCPELPGIHFEVKRCEKGNPYDWIAQAIADSDGGEKLAVVAHKRNHSKWLIVMPASDFFYLVRRGGTNGGPGPDTPS